MVNNQQNINQQQQSNQLQQESIQQAQTLLESLKEVLGIRTKLTEFERDTLNTNKKLAELVKKQTTEYNSVAEKTKEIAKNETALRQAKLTTQGLENSLSQTKKQQVEAAKRLVEQQADLNKKIQAELEKVERGEAIDRRRLAGLKGRLTQVDALVDAEFEMLTPLQKQLLYTQLTTQELEEQNKQRRAELKELEKVEDLLGVAGKLTKTLGQIPGLGDTAAKAYETVFKKLVAARQAGEEMPSKFKTMVMVVQEVGKSILKSLKDPLTLTLGAVTLLVKAFLDSDKAVVGLQKTLNVSADEARAINMEFSAFALSVDNILVNSRSMAATFGAIQSKIGSVGKVSGDTAATFARLTKSVGLTEEEAAGIVTQSNAFGKSSNEVYKSVLGTTQEVSRQYKTNINQKAVLADIGKTSAYTLVQFRGSTTALAEGIAKAKALGLEMNTLKNISSGLLNFQQSIEDELAAELLTGKQLNLEQARYYALTNQQSKLMDELQTQIGNYSDFTKLNVVQQEAYAKSLGMTTDQLSEMLFKQEYMKNTAQEQAMTDEERIQKQIEAITLQEKFQAAIEKMQATFADFVAGPVGAFLTSTTGIYTVLGLIAATTIPKLIAGFGPLLTLVRAIKVQEIGSAIASAWTAAMSGPQSILTGGLVGAAIGAGLTAAIMGAVAFADDLYSPGQGSSGYGKRMLVAPEGTFALNNKDNIIATTNPVNVNDMISGPAGRFNVSTPSAAIKSTQAQINVAPADTRISLNLNGAALGNATARQNYQVGNTVKALGGAVDYSAPL